MLIGISGKKQCGKNTVCSIIQKIDSYLYSVGYKAELCTKEEVIHAVLNFKSSSLSEWGEHSFAEILKVCASVILGNPIYKFESEDFKNKTTSIELTDSDGNTITNRRFLQLFGTEVGRNIDPDIWIKALMRRYKDESSDLAKPKWIITDVRFPNEADTIKREGGLLIRVNRETNSNDSHPSEIALDNYEDFDEIIDNNGSMEDLIGQIYDIILKYKLI